MPTVATDVDPNTAGDQEGSEAEQWEGMLLRLMTYAPFNIVEHAGSEGGGRFRVRFSSAPEMTLVIDPFISGPFPEQPTSYSSITGIYTQFTTYRLQPRRASEMVPL